MVRASPSVKVGLKTMSDSLINLTNEIDLGINVIYFDKSFSVITFKNNL